MKINEPQNPNYSAIVVEIKTIVPLDNCDNVVHAIIMGNKIVTSKETKIGDIGLFFPVEVELSKEYLMSNSLYNKPELNADSTKKGFFDLNGRVRCQKFRGNASEGLFMPISSLNFMGIDVSELSLGDSFDELNGTSICKKYVINKRILGIAGTKKSRDPKVSKIIDNQFKFHADTEQLFRNMHRINPDDIISITYKIHGTSFIASHILCKKPLAWYDKVFKFLRLNIVDTCYDYVWSSRKVVKNADLNPNANHFYDVDIWGIAHKEVQEFLQEGMTIYGEIAGYTPTGGAIQGLFDYGCKPNEHKNYVYRVTYTNTKGKVFEFSAKQVQNFCAENGLNAVPQLFYGYAKDFYDEFVLDQSETKVLGEVSNIDIDFWRDGFLQAVKSKYNEKDCYICKNKVPEEGCVVRIEQNKVEAYKCKSLRFLEGESEDLNKGVADIESEN